MASLQERSAETVGHATAGTGDAEQQRGDDDLDLELFAVVLMLIVIEDPEKHFSIARDSYRAFHVFLLFWLMHSQRPLLVHELSHLRTVPSVEIFPGCCSLSCAATPLSPRPFWALAPYVPAAHFLHTLRAFWSWNRPLGQK